MAINKHQKEALVSSMKKNFNEVESAFLVGVRGLKVEQLRVLRGKLRQNNGKLQVAKVRLMKRAVAGSDSEQSLSLFLKNQVAFVFSNDEVTVTAKMLCDFAKETEGFSVVAGVSRSIVFDKDEVLKLSLLPSRNVLLGQLVGTIQAPITGFVVCLNQMMTKLVYVLGKIEEQKK